MMNILFRNSQTGELESIPRLEAEIIRLAKLDDLTKYGPQTPLPAIYQVAVENLSRKEEK